MLIFQINRSQLEKELTPEAWSFWNAYLTEHIQKDDYVLLPDFIEYFIDTHTPNNEQEQEIAVELEDENDDYIE